MAEHVNSGAGAALCTAGRTGACASSWRFLRVVVPGEYEGELHIALVVLAGSRVLMGAALAALCVWEARQARGKAAGSATAAAWWMGLVQQLAVRSELA